MPKLYVILIMLCSMATTKAQHINTDSIGTKTISDNLYNKSLFGDSLASSFVIVIKKEVKLHKHLRHSEHVIVLEGSGHMQLGDKHIEIKKGDVIFVPKNTVHSAKSTGTVPLKVLSVQSPNFDGKDRVFIE